MLLHLALACVPQTVSVPKDLAADFTVPDGLEVTLWAEAPLFFNPTAMDTDSRGRIWVTEAVNYRKWRGRNPGLVHPDGDRVMILEDTDGDGDADTSSVFVQDKELVAPLGICVIDDHRALVSCSPNAFLYTDTDGDGKADKRETFLTGFGGHDHDHGLHSFVIGPDGRYYVAVGNAGPHIVTDRDGSTLRSGSLYNDGGEFVADNKPGLVSDDGRVWVGGLILRFDEDGGGLSVRAHNFRNEYEVTLDSLGDMYTSDNDDDGSQGCRALKVLPRSNNGYFSNDGSRYWNADRRPGQETRRAHWHQDDPGIAPCGALTGAGGPTGVTTIEGANLGERKGWLAADAGAGCVFEIVGETSSKFLAPKERADDGGKSKWFRPSDVLVGTDGALYVSDWFDPGVGGHAMGDKVGYGRILRVVKKGASAKAPKVDLKTIPGAIEALTSSAVTVRGRAARILLFDPQWFSSDAILRNKSSDADPATRARIEWILASRPPPPLRPGGAGASVIAMRSKVIPRSEWKSWAIGPEGTLRLEVAMLLESDTSSDVAVFTALANAYDGADRTYLEALGMAARGHEAEYFAALSEQSEDPLAWDSKLADLAWRLHPPSCVSAVKSRALATSLSKDRRVQAIDTLAFTQDRSAGEAMLDIALAGPEDTREYAKWWIRFRDTNDWSAWRFASQIESTDRAKAKLLFESPVMQNGVATAIVNLKGATQLYLVVDDGGNGNGCDWADWADGVLSGPGGEMLLADLPWIDAAAGWGEVHKNKNCNGGPLVVAGKPVKSGIGTHANSEIAIALPPGKFETLTVQVGPDEQGVKQAGGTSVRFKILAELPPDTAQYAKLEARVLDTALALDERTQAARELCSTREGGLLVLASADKGKYDADAQKLLASAIFANPDLAVRALASEKFSRPASAMPSVAELLKLHGDEKNGERVFFGAKADCAKCHTFAGRGGDLGPDLTALRAKSAPQAILDAILNPSAGIAFGFDTWMLETDEDRVVSGFLLADGEKVIVKDTSGVRTVLDKSEIVARRKAKVSAMPDNASAGLSAQELADVVAFLSAERDAPRKFGEPIDLFAQGFTGWTHYLDQPNAKLADVWSIEDGVIDCKGNPIGYLRTEATYEDFVLELDWRFPAGGKPGNSGVLLRRVGADKVWPKSVEAQLQHRHAGDIWNIDEFPMQVDRARTDGRHTEKLAPCNEKPLGEWNHYKITLIGGNMTLEVNGTVQNTATWIERVPGNLCLQSEGSRIQFRNVVLRKVE